MAGLGGEGSKVWEIVVVAVTTEERRWDMSIMESGLRGWYEEEGWAGDEEVGADEDGIWGSKGLVIVML